MPRIRTIKPEIWQDEAVAGVSRDAQLLFIGLITQADDAGRLRGKPTLLRSQIFPYDDDLTAAEIDTWLAELERVDLIQRYSIDNFPYIQLSGWSNQRIKSPSPSKLPANPHQHSDSPPLEKRFPNDSETLPPLKDQGRDQGEEGNARAREADKLVDEIVELITAEYPSPIGKHALPVRLEAERRVLAGETAESIKPILTAWKSHDRWHEEGGRYVPNPQNFLSDPRYHRLPDGSPAADATDWDREAEEVHGARAVA